MSETKRYMVWISIRDKKDNELYSIPILAELLKKFRTEKGAKAYVQRVLEHMK